MLLLYQAKVGEVEQSALTCVTGALPRYQPSRALCDVRYCHTARCPVPSVCSYSAQQLPFGLPCVCRGTAHLLSPYGSPTRYPVLTLPYGATSSTRSPRRFWTLSPYGSHTRCPVLIYRRVIPPARLCPVLTCRMVLPGQGKAYRSAPLSA
eukprot:3941993-Rhodomonas_salina.6